MNRGQLRTKAEWLEEYEKLTRCRNEDEPCPAEHCEDCKYDTNENEASLVYWAYVIFKNNQEGKE